MFWLYIHKVSVIQMIQTDWKRKNEWNNLCENETIIQMIKMKQFLWKWNNHSNDIQMMKMKQFFIQVIRISTINHCHFIKKVHEIRNSHSIDFRSNMWNNSFAFRCSADSKQTFSQNFWMKRKLYLKAFMSWSELVSFLKACWKLLRVQSDTFEISQKNVETSWWWEHVNRFIIVNCSVRGTTDLWFDDGKKNNIHEWKM